MNDDPNSRQYNSLGLGANLTAGLGALAIYLACAAAQAEPLGAPTADDASGDSSMPNHPVQQDHPVRQDHSVQQQGDVGARPPLIVLDLSERWIAELADRLFDERSCVDVSVLGVRVRGTARTEGGYTIRCVDGDGGLCFAIDAHGTSISLTRGRQGPALVRAVTTTDFSARKVVELQGRSLVARPTSVEAMMRRCDSAVDTRCNLGRWLVRRIAKRRIRAGWAEIKGKSERLTEQRVTAAVDRSVERFRRDANERLQRMQAQFPWIGWGDDTTPVHLQTGDRMLRLTWRDGGGEMVDPFYLAVGEPGPGLRLWIDRRALRVESQRLRQRLRRMWRTAAMLAPILPNQSPDAPWSVELALSAWALEVTVPSAGLLARVPGPRDPMTAILTAAAHSFSRAGMGGERVAPSGQDDATTTPNRRDAAR